ncbi:MAG: O-methyltransferase [Ilumatobacter sp.]|nr:O-methyltransferase [Ilumatobacter sp.]
MKSFGIDQDILTYAAGHANPSDDVVSEQLAAATRERFGDWAGMNIDGDQGRFLEAIVAISGARTVVEVGTFTGMSALWLARGLPAGGRLTCFELEETYHATALAAWEAAGVADRIDVRFGPAADGLAALPEEPHVDLAFVDADKGGYLTYVDLLLPRIVDDGAILVDNVLWSGAVVDASDTSDNTQAIRAFNDAIAQRDDCTAVILTIGDGVTLIRPRR